MTAEAPSCNYTGIFNPVTGFVKVEGERMVDGILERSLRDKLNEAKRCAFDKDRDKLISQAAKFAQKAGLEIDDSLDASDIIAPSVAGKMLSQLEKLSVENRKAFLAGLLFYLPNDEREEFKAYVIRSSVKANGWTTSVDTFNAFQESAAWSAYELVVLKKEGDDSVSVYLNNRSENDPYWPGQPAIPGSVPIRSDAQEDGSLVNTLNRLKERELAGLEVSEPVSISPSFHEGPRGCEATLPHYCYVTSGEPENGYFCKISLKEGAVQGLPENTIEHHKIIIQNALLALAENSNGSNH